MKLIDLFEEEDDDDFDYDYIIDKIENECGEMLKAYRQSSGRVLYRGTDNKGLVFSQAKIRQDRRPVEMDVSSHNLINKALASLDLPTRGNSLFVSADLDIARAWGKPAVIFLPDGWKGLVYDNIRAHDYSFDELQPAAGDLIAYHAGLSEDEKVKKMADAILKLKPRTFTTAADLKDVLIRKTADILIHGQSYYKLSLDTKHRQRYKKIVDMLGMEF